MRPGFDQTRDAWIRSQTRICSQTRYRLTAYTALYSGFVPAAIFVLAGLFVPAAYFVPAANFVLAGIFVPTPNFVLAGFFVPAADFVPATILC